VCIYSTGLGSWGGLIGGIKTWGESVGLAVRPLLFLASCWLVFGAPNSRLSLLKNPRSGDFGAHLTARHEVGLEAPCGLGRRGDCLLGTNRLGAGSPGGMDLVLTAVE